MSNPRTKRQFAGAASDPTQRQITSFFNSTTPTAHPSSSSPSPVIPSQVQSNLLSVGMRVRKSVPEGYKTGTYSGFSLWDEKNSRNPIQDTMGEGQRSRANAISTPRELMPFCGINSIGGLAPQPEPSSRSMGSNAAIAVTPSWQPTPSIFDSSMDDDVPGLTSSQETVSSDISPPPSASRSRKRFFVEEEEEDRLAIPTSFNLRSNHNSRAIATPRKGRHRAKAGSNETETGSPGQENVMVVDSDFEDADFFDQSKWEVEMNDA
ncbi:ribonucleotide reductase inhibitor-domain-containing protein [Xylariaceae sp. FL1019]|nr:ribonucleotide reductase inhibitor-domain-containing protein [Xylariaceae sp. FL1019]